MTKLIIVNIPAYNEAEGIAHVIKSIPRIIDDYPVKIQVVDDWSHDGTAEVAKHAGADYIISHIHNQWIGAAFKTWVTHFFQVWWDIFVNIDADGQFNPLDIPNIVQPLLSYKADIVLASRFGVHTPTNMPAIKYRLNKIIASIVSTLSKYKVDDLTCGFRAYSRESLLRLNLMESFTYTQEVVIDAIGKRMRLFWVPVCVKYFATRKSRVTSRLIKYIWRSLIIVWRTLRDNKPTLFFGFPGIIFSLLWFALLLFFLISYLLSFKTTPYHMFFNVWVFLFGLGILLMIFWSIADMMKNQRKLTEDNMYILRKMFYDKK